MMQFIHVWKYGTTGRFQAILQPPPRAQWAMQMIIHAYIESLTWLESQKQQKKKEMDEWKLRCKKKIEQSHVWLYSIVTTSQKHPSFGTKYKCLHYGLQRFSATHHLTSQPVSFWPFCRRQTLWYQPSTPKHRHIHSPQRSTKTADGSQTWQSLNMVSYVSPQY